ncbi:hypothetical protein BDR26DRAFT_872634 [Obelidium mucronatum]|nr:hypothetical protein BDR26DRAFT_872634 [Obelidium mucronatum]
MRAIVPRVVSSNSNSNSKANNNAAASNDDAKSSSSSSGTESGSGSEDSDASEDEGKPAAMRGVARTPSPQPVAALAPATSVPTAAEVLSSVPSAMATGPSAARTPSPSLSPNLQPPAPAPTAKPAPSVPIEAQEKLLSAARALGPELADLAPLVSTYSSKLYAKGYVYAMPAQFATGSTLGLGWAKYWAELYGSRLSLYLVPEAMAAAPYFPTPSVQLIMDSEGSTVSSKVIDSLKTSPPLNLSLSNALSEILPFGFQPPLGQSSSPPPPTPYDICIAVNTNGSNLLYLALRSSIAANHWVTAIRLSQYEASKINLYVTLRRLGSGMVTPGAESQLDASGSPESDGARAWRDVGLTPFKTSSVGQVKGFGTPIFMEGWVNVRVGYAQTWQLLYAVVGNVTVAGDYDRAENPSDKKKGAAQKVKSEQKEQNRTSFLKIFNKKDKKENPKKPGNAGPEADIASGTNIYLAAAGGATGFKKPDLAFYESVETYRNGDAAIFRVENVTQACFDYTSFCADNFHDLCETSSTAPASTLEDGAHVPAVRIQGSIIGGEESPDSEGNRQSKSPKSFLNTATSDPEQLLDGYDYISALKTDSDPRPKPESIQFMPVIKTASDTLDPYRWITATLGTFHLEANMISREVEFREGDLGIKPFDMEVVKKGAARHVNSQNNSKSSPLAGLSSALNSGGSGRGFGVFQFAVETGSSGWGLLYLKTDEVAGLSQAPPETGVTAKKMFELVLGDKKAARKSGFLDKWADAVGKGVEARMLVERKEVLEKVKGLMQWLDAQKGGAGVGDVLHEGNYDYQEPGPEVDEDEVADEQPPQPEETVMTPTNERSLQLSDARTPLAQVPIAPPASAAASAAPALTENTVSNTGPDIVKTDLVLVAVPVLQPDGTWSWQYQFANQSAVENGAGPIQAFATQTKSGATPKSHQQKEAKDDDDEDGDENDDEDDEDADEDDDDEDDDDEEDDSDDDNMSLAASMHSASKRNSAAMSVSAAKLRNRQSGISLSQSEGGSRSALLPGMTTANQLNSTYGIPMMGPAGVLVAPGVIPGSFLPVAAPKSVVAGKSPAKVLKKRVVRVRKVKKVAVKEAKDDDDEDSNDDEGSQSEESGDEEEEEEEFEEYEEYEEEYEEDDDQSLAGATDPHLLRNPMMMMPGFPGAAMFPQMPNMIPGTMPMLPFPGMPDMNQQLQQEQEEEELDEKKYKIYADNSLLAQLPDRTAGGVLLDKSPSRRPPGAAGPLVSLPTDVKAAQEKALKLRNYEQAIKTIGLGAAKNDPEAVEDIRQRFDGLVLPGNSAGFSLATNAQKAHVPPPKPKIEGGLLGEVDKWEKEKDALKKMGAYRASMMMPPGNQFVPPSRPVSGADHFQRPTDQFGRPLSMFDPQAGMYHPMQPPPMQQHYSQGPFGMVPPGSYAQPPYGQPNVYPPLPPPPLHQQPFGYPQQMPNQYAYQYSEYGHEGGWEDPSLAANHHVLRQQFLETERVKERQRMMERGELPKDYQQERNGSGSDNSSQPKNHLSKGKGKGKPSRRALYDSDDSDYDDQKPVESSGTESSDEVDDDDSEEEPIVDSDDDGSSESSDRQSLASRKQKPLSNQQSTVIQSIKSARPVPRVPSDNSDNYSRASSGGVLLQATGALNQNPGVPIPQQSDYQQPHMAPYPGMTPYQRPPIQGYNQPPLPAGGMYYQPPQAQQYSNDYQQNRMSYAAGPDPQRVSYAGSSHFNPMGSPQPQPQLPNTLATGRELIGERKRPTLPMRNASEAAAEEEAERKERERERRRRLRRRGIEVEEPEEYVATEDVVAPPPPPVARAPIAATHSPVPTKAHEEPEVRSGGRDLLDADELDKILERAGRKKKASKKQKEVESDDGDSSSSDEEIVIVRRKKKKGKSKVRSTSPN